MSYEIILIAGVARSGKSTITKELRRKLGYACLSTDNLRFMLEKRFTDEESHFPREERKPRTFKYVESLIKTLVRFDEVNQGVIIEGNVLEPENMAKIQLKKVEKVCFGYPYADVGQKLAEIRDYRHDYDWTDKYSDEEMKKQIAELIKISKRYEEECREFGIKFFDVSDFEEGIARAREYFGLS